MIAARRSRRAPRERATLTHTFERPPPPHRASPPGFTEEDAANFDGSFYSKTKVRAVHESHNLVFRVERRQGSPVAS